MRILFTFAGGAGHFLPMAPIAHAAERAGHTVAVAHRDDQVTGVQAEGFTSFTIDAARVLEPGISPILEMDRELAETRARDSFAVTIAPERAAGVLHLIRTWHPDLIVMDEMDYGSGIAAEHAGIPRASVLVIVAGGVVRADLIAEPLNALRARYGLPADPDLSQLRSELVLSPFPARFRDPAHPLPANAHSLRATASPPPEGVDLGDLPVRTEGRPTVYFTLGTEFAKRSGDLFQRVFTGLSELDIHLVVTVGRQIDPTDLGPQPANVHILQYVPQSLLLPHCDLVVSHGGSGSVTGALEHGVPLVVLPLGADQMHNAARCTALGVGVTVDAVRATSEEIKDAVSTVLNRPAYRHAAETLRTENDLLPDAGHAVRLLQDLVEKHRRIDLDAADRIGARP